MFGQSLEALAAAFRTNPTAGNQAALVRYASAHSKDENGALALLAIGVTEADQGNAANAIRLLREAKPRLARIRDHVGYHLARALYQAGQYADAIEELDAPLRGKPRSPLRPYAVVLAARAHLRRVRRSKPNGYSLSTRRRCRSRAGWK
jgi:tetratricopeptide (TPR) repeat protein